MSNSEKGHAKNVANFEKLIMVCQGFGAKYAPSKTAIKIVNLQAKLTASDTILDDIKTAVANNRTAVNNRRAAFKGYRKYSTRILAALKATDATEETVNNAISINKKIQGIRITDEKPPKSDSETTPPVDDGDNTISTAQTSYTNIVDHFKSLKTLLVAQAAVYTPNETDLKTTAVTTYINNLDALNTGADNAATTLSNQLISRNHNFYDDKTGIPDIAIAVKDYIKSVYGAGSPEYKLASKIKFTTPAKK